MSDSVGQLLRERIDGEIQSTVWYRASGSARYGLVGSLTDDGRAWLTIVILDVEEDTLRIHGDNSMWLPADGDVMDGAIRSLARTATAANGSLPDDDPMQESLLDYSAEEIAAYEIEDDYEPRSPGEDWKATDGAQERYEVHERLQESPIENADRLIRLEFGGKDPWEGEPQRIMRPPEEIGGNYGVEVSEDDDLVIVDVDDMDAAPIGEFPETLGAESPHGGEHFYYHVPGWLQVFQDRFNVDNPHPSWGEIRSQDGYVVGPGSELTGCKHEDCCSEDSPGEYALVDAPIATIDADDLADLIATGREEIEA